MANRPQGYGLSGEMEQKMAGKYKGEDQEQVVGWICSITKVPSPLVGKASEPQPKVVHEWLKDGQVLFKLMNAIKPGSISKVNDVSKSKMAAIRKNKEMENISFFLNACEKYGVGRSDLFQTVDLYECQNMSQVLQTMFALSGKSIKVGYPGPKIGVKKAEPNKREHSEQKLKEGRNVIGLQMGSVAGASQKNMTPYGLGRQLT